MKKTIIFLAIIMMAISVYGDTEINQTTTTEPEEVTTTTEETTTTTTTIPRIVIEEIEGRNYTFPTKEWYCKKYFRGENCTKTSYEAYKASEIQKRIEIETQQKEISDAVASTNKSAEEGIFKWVIDKLMWIIDKFTQSDDRFGELCRKDPELSWCK